MEHSFMHHDHPPSHKLRSGTQTSDSSSYSAGSWCGDNDGRNRVGQDKPQPDIISRCSYLDLASSVSIRDSIGSLTESQRELGDYPTLSRYHERSASAVIDELQDSSSSSSSSNYNVFDMKPWKKTLMIAVFCAVHLCYGSYYALLGPFFPALADERDIGGTMTGVLLGVFELICVGTSLVFGKYLNRIGAKWMYLTGTMAFGYTTILMGFLEYCPGGWTFVAVTFAIRTFENIAVSGTLTAAFAILASAYPDNVSTMFGTLELFNGLGMMVGPVIGGVLYDVGGFKAPFIILGSLTIFVGFSGIFLIPSLQASGFASHNRSMFALLRVPTIFLMASVVFVGSSAMSFLDVALSVFLKYKFQLSAISMGLVFMMGGGVYSLCSPVWGKMADRWIRFSNIYIIVGYVVSGVGFQFLGPAPYLPIKSDLLWLVYVSMGVIGIGLGSMIVTFEVIAEAAQRANYLDNLETNGLISGLWNSVYCFGAFFGSVFGGLLYDRFDFQLPSAAVGWMQWTLAFLLLAFTLCERKKKIPQCQTDDLINNNEYTPILDHTNGSHGNERTITHYYSINTDDLSNT